jgi:hypothetical protein
MKSSLMSVGWNQEGSAAGAWQKGVKGGADLPPYDRIEPAAQS